MKLVITGGGSGGHIQPLVAIVSKLQKEQKDIGAIFWLGSKKGMERQASQDLGVPFHNIPAGKLRRYFDWHNFTDVFKTLSGIIKAYVLLGRLKPDLIFSKGGFISFPVVFAGWLRHIPIIAHESDVVPGLTTKLCLPFVTKQCLGFAESKKYFKSTQKLVVTGIPLREIILKGTAQKGLKFLNLSEKKKPLLLILGGSLGAKKINELIVSMLKELTAKFTVVHMTGVGKQTINVQANYFPFTSFKEELADLYQAADIIISRAGATTLAEILSLQKKAVLIPLDKDQSRGDQIINAQMVEKLHVIRVVPEAKLSPTSLQHALNDLLVEKNTEIPMNRSHSKATENVVREILDSRAMRCK